MHVVAEDRGLARGGADQAHQHLQRRRLARAVGAHEAEDLAFAHAERDPVQHPLLAQPEAGAEVLDDVSMRTISARGPPCISSPSPRARPSLRQRSRAPRLSE